MPQGTRIIFMFVDTMFPGFPTFWDLPYPQQGGVHHRREVHEGTTASQLVGGVTP